jgi:hypothetical protein
MVGFKKKVQKIKQIACFKKGCFEAVLSLKSSKEL